MQFINYSSKKAAFLTLLHEGLGRICKRDIMNRRGGENQLPKPGGRGPGSDTAIGGCPEPARWEGVSWKAGKPALAGEKGEQRINLKGIAGTQTQMFWQVIPHPYGL